MTDRELDRMMQRVLLDAIKRDCENTRNPITWFDPQTNIQFSLNANVNQDDILHIAESVSLVKTEN